MTSKDFQDLARVYRAGAASFADHGRPAPTGVRENAQAFEAMAATCETVAAERSATERRIGSEY